MLPTLYSAQEGVSTLDFILEIIVSVLVNIVAYYVCRWLDRHGNGGQKKIPGESPLPGDLPCGENIGFILESITLLYHILYRQCKGGHKISHNIFANHRAKPKKSRRAATLRGLLYDESVGFVFDPMSYIIPHSL